MASARVEPVMPAETAVPAVPPHRIGAGSVPPGMQIAASWSWRLLVVLAVAAVLVYLVIQLREVIIPLFIAVVASALLVPFSNWLQRHRWPKGIAVAVAEIGVIVLVGGLLYLVITQVVSQFDDLRSQSIEAYRTFQDFLRESPLQVSQREFDDYVRSVVDSVQADSGVLVGGALSLGSSLGHILAGVLLALFAALFILIDGGGIWRWIVHIFPRRARDAVNGAGVAGWNTLQNFVKVQILVAAIDAIGIGVGAAIIGVPLAIPIAVLVFLGSFVPIVGAVVTGALAVFIALVYLGLVPALWMLGVVLLVQQIEGHVLQPLIMGTAVKVHPLAVVLAVGTGAFVGGIPGAFFAVPFVATANTMVKYVASGAWKSERGLPPRHGLQVDEETVAPPANPTAAPEQQRTLRRRTRTKKDRTRD
ncbi:AI-2E family transporter [Planctomonas deserti]|uniref:AI-2E family transporter n=1 Tax=Planctomonas deserti TaxID=2144185 RepID=UPI001F0CD850|nr:AI-2E family transporter [Planctomonas deserti]